VPVKEIFEQLRHETSAFTMKRYAHVVPGMQAEAVALMAWIINREDKTIGDWTIVCHEL
jgi:hypothetical protein